MSKTFPGTRALNDVSLEVESGTIHCLLGGNGSGKSSLIKILAGVYQGDPGGTITVDDVSERGRPDHARMGTGRGLALRASGPGGVQRPVRGREPCHRAGVPRSAVSYGAIRWRALNRRARAVLDRFQIHVDPKRLLADLRPADHTMVAIARALQDQSLAGDEGILVLDEPTVALPSAEVDVLFSALRQYARAGQTILLVTHRLEEVISIADRVTVLRDGSVAATLDAGQFDHDKLVELIVGRALDSEVSGGVTIEGEDLLLEVADLSVGPLHGVTFGLRRGEVLGVAGLLGSGRTTLLTTLFGLRPMAHGTTSWTAHRSCSPSVDQAMDAGLAFVPENRSDSAFLDMDLRENLSAADVPKYWHRFVLHQRKEAEDARRSIAGLLDQGHLGVPALRHPLGRQPAEGRRGPMASAQAPTSPSRRADPGGGHRGPR